MTEDIPGGGVPRWLKSVGAVVAGIIAVIVLSTATDAVLHATRVFPPADQMMMDPMLFLLALTYRGVFTLLGGWVTARLAPAAPMKHVVILAIIGLLLGGLGVLAAVATDQGPLWYAVAVAITGPLLTLVGGRLHRRAA